MNRFSDIVLTSLLALILISCQITESPQPAPISVALPTSTTISVVETATTPPPTPESTSTAIPTHTPETAVCTIPNPETIPLPESAHDTIAYISESEDEEEMLTLLATNGRWQSNTPMPGWLFQDAPTPHYLLFPTEPLNLDTPVLQELFADTCQVSPEEASRSGTKPNTCYDFKVSPNQQWAAAKTNYNSCGSDLALIDLRGDVPTITKPDFLDPASGHGIHYFRFIGDDELWLAVGHCQGGDFYILDINSGEVTWIGTAGPDRWIANRAAVAVSGGTYIGGYGTRTWGYNTETNDYFLPSTDTAGRILMDTRPNASPLPTTRY